LFCAEFSLFHFFYVLKLNFCLLLIRTIFGGAYTTKRWSANRKILPRVSAAAVA